MKTLFNRYLGFLLVAAMLVTAACSGETDQQEANNSVQPEIEQGDAQSAPSQKLNVNTASGDEFRTIPDVGDQMVHEFEEYRPYVSIQQFRREIGKYVDEEQVAAFEEHIYVPIQVNDSDSETLQQIPGLDAEEAETLISERPFDSNEAFLERLSEFVNEEERATAERYLDSE